MAEIVLVHGAWHGPWCWDRVTAELRERIRARLREALLALESPDDAPSDLLDNPVIAALALKQQDDPAIKSRLRRALEGFDQACISTIHGFCRKILQQNAFESGAHFEMELVPDHGPLLQDIVDDFWTAEFHNATPLWLDAASVANKGASRQHLLALAKAATADLRLTLVPPFREDAEKVPSLAAFTEARDALKGALALGDAHRHLFKYHANISSRHHTLLHPQLTWWI